MGRGRPRGNTLTPDGHQIKALREKAGFAKQQALASKAGLSLRAVEDIEQGQRTNEAALRKVAAALGLAADDYTRLLLGGGEPIGLPACQARLLEWAAAAKDEGEFLVRTLAINLSDGWEVIEAAIDRSAAPALDFRVLVLTPDPRRLPADAPPHVAAWSKSVDANLSLIREGLARHSAGKPVRMEARAYRQVPGLHGIHVATEKSGRYAISRCEARSGTFGGMDWGASAYRLFPADTGVPLVRLREEYDADFEGKWASGDPLFIFTPPGRS